VRAAVKSLGIEERVRFLEKGSVDDPAMDGLYAVSTMLVHPSLAEGFGFPVVEAMERGVPVACANRGSLPEVAGGAAELFDPTRIEAITEAISRVLDDRARRDELVAAGRRRAGQFSWRQNGAATLESIDRAARDRAR
jgi:alpha-1,3-rhamnosyl/mannosyltransferase